MNLSSYHNALINEESSSLLPHAPKDATLRRETDGATALHLIARDAYAEDPGVEELIDALLASGADINARDGSGNTPARLALVRGRAFVAIALIKRGADLTIEDDRGERLVHIAANLLGYDVIDAIKAAGGDIWAPDRRGVTLKQILHDAHRRYRR